MTYNPTFEDGHCEEAGHIPGCPGAAGGDHELAKPRCRRCGKRLMSDGSCDSCAFDLHVAIKEQRTAGGYVVAPLSMLRCSECGDLLDAYGCCIIHGLLDTESRDGDDA